MAFSTGTGLTGALFVDPEMGDVLSDDRWLAAMLDVEAALARAQAETGVIPRQAAEAIAGCCDPMLYDIAEIGRRATLAGNPAIPLVAMLTERVAARDAAAAGFVHYGATSQDVIDSALGLQLEAALELCRARVAACCHAAAALARRHRRTVMPGRTLLQHALPIAFGLKAAHWLDALVSSHDNMSARLGNWLQFGGAAGTLAALGGNGPETHAELARARLPSRAPFWPEGFSDPTLPWHATRGHLQLIAAQLGILCSSLGKIARDIALLMQTEVAEAFEPAAPGKGGSSTLPHKRNPVLTVAIVAAATRAPGLVATMLAAGLQEHERGVGGWHAEWDVMRELAALAGAAALHMRTLLEGLEVDVSRMRANLELTQGLVMAERIAFALAPTMGKAGAKRLMDEACQRAVRERRPLRDILAETPEAAALDLPALFDPETYLGASDLFIDRILALYEDEKQYMPDAPPAECG